MATKNNENKMDGKHLEFLMDLSEIQPYLDNKIYRELFAAFSKEDGKGIINALMAICILIGSLQNEIQKKEKQRIDYREEWKACLTEKQQMEREFRSIYASQFGKYFHAKKLYEFGFSLTKIAAEMGVNRETVRKYLTSLGIKIRNNKSGRPKSPVKDLKKDDGFYVDIDDVANGII